MTPEPPADPTPEVPPPAPPVEPVPAPAPADEPVPLVAASPPVPEESPAPEPPPKPRRRWPVRLAALGLAAGGLGWFAPSIVAHSPLRDVAVRRATDGLLNGTVTVGGASLGWLRPVELRDVRVTDPAGNVIGTAPVARTTKTLWEFVRDQADLGTITVEKPAVTFVCGADTSNVEDLIRPLLGGPTGTGDRAALVVDVTGGVLTVKGAADDPGKTFDPVAVTVTVPRPRAEPITLAAGATAPGTPAGRLDAALSFGTPFVGTFAAAGFPAGTLDPVVRRFAAGTVASGTVTGKVTITDTGMTVVEPVTAVAADVGGPWLAGDRLQLARVELKPGRVGFRDGVLELTGADVAADVGTVSVAGSFDTAGRLRDHLATPGLRVAADLDVARLAAALPHLLRVRAGTEVHSGRVAVRLESVAKDDGTAWSGSVRTTAVRAVRDGKPFAWDQPLAVEFAGRFRPDGLPEFDKLEARGDFVGLAARGTREDFAANANLNLDRLAAHLAEFVDLGGVSLSGTATLSLRATHRPDGTTAVTAAAELMKFSATDASGRGVAEPDLKLNADGNVRFARSGPLEVSAGTLTMTAGTDQLVAELKEPVADLRDLRAGAATARVTGDMARWHRRAAGLIGGPPSWSLGGTGAVAGDVRFGPDAVTCGKLTADLADARFRGFGLTLDEPRAKAECGLAADRRTGAVTLTDVRVSTQTAGAASPRVEIVPLPGGETGVKGTASVTADLRRVQRATGAAAEPPVEGTATGQVRFDVGEAGAVGFDGAFDLDKLLVGPATDPVWAEPWAKLAAAGRWSPRADVVRFDKLRVERDGLSADATGAFAKLGSAAPGVELAGTTTYDLAKLQPHLRTFLGAGATAVGRETKAFKLATVVPGTELPEVKRPPGGLTFAADASRRPGRPGGVAPPPQPAPPPTPLPGQRLFDVLTGSAAVGWQSVKAYGFDVGPAELRAGLDRGVVTFSPVEAQFGSGTVRLVPTLGLNPGARDLTFAPGRVVSRAKLTPAACADAVGFILPPLANAAEVEGTVSLDLASARVPLADPTKAAAAGTLLVHAATVSPGPMFAQVADLLGAKQTSLTLSGEQAVPFRVENGRVYHERFAVTFDKLTVRSTGSVGFDGSVDLVFEVPFPPSFAPPGLAARPVLRDALAKQTLAVPVRGTLNKPQLDRGRLDDAVRKVLQGLAGEAGKDAGRAVLADLLKKGEERLQQKLDEKAKPPGK